MLRENFNHGYSSDQWEAAKKEATAAMVKAAKRRGMVTYTELVDSISTIRLQPHDTRLAHMLGEISAEEEAAGRGMLTVVVVHKLGDMEPGKGFYELAAHLGRDTSDPQRCWVEELHRVHAEWGSKK